MIEGIQQIKEGVITTKKNGMKMTEIDGEEMVARDQTLTWIEGMQRIQCIQKINELGAIVIQTTHKQWDLIVPIMVIDNMIMSRIMVGAICILISVIIMMMVV